MGEDNAQNNKLTAPARSYEDVAGDPATLNTIVEHCSQGGSLIELCKTWGVSFGRVMKWLRADKDRFKQYAESLIDRNEWFKEAVLLELRSLSMADIREAFDEAGVLKHPQDWPDSLARAISGFEIDELFEGTGRDRRQVGQTRKLKLWDKKGALELIGKTLAMFIDKQQHTVEKSLEDLVLESYQGEKTDGSRAAEGANGQAVGSDSSGANAEPQAADRTGGGG
jgi:hypothetical protein